MKALYVVVVALVAAVVLTSLAAAGPNATKQRVIFGTQAPKTTQISPAALTTLDTGAIKSDSGKLIASSFTTNKEVVRGGQEITINDGPATFKGKLGTLVLRYHAEWVQAGNGYHVASSTWKVVRGTGQYAGVTGGGRGASVWLESNDHWSSRDEGFLTAP
jgi:hypothetical protein